MVINEIFIMENAEDHLKNLDGVEAKAKLKELVERAENCFFCSGIKTGLPFSTRPMSEQLVDDDGGIWFLSRKDSGKNAEITQDPLVQLLFQDIPALVDFLQVIQEVHHHFFKHFQHHHILFVGMTVLERAKELFDCAVVE